MMKGDTAIRKDVLHCVRERAVTDIVNKCSADSREFDLIIMLDSHVSADAIMHCFCEMRDTDAMSKPRVLGPVKN